METGGEQGPGAGEWLSARPPTAALSPNGFSLTGFNHVP